MMDFTADAVTELDIYSKWILILAIHIDWVEQD